MTLPGVIEDSQSLITELYLNTLAWNSPLDTFLSYHSSISLIHFSISEIHSWTTSNRRSPDPDILPPHSSKPRSPALAYVFWEDLLLSSFSESHFRFEEVCSRKQNIRLFAEVISNLKSVKQIERSRSESSYQPQKWLRDLAENLLIGGIEIDTWWADIPHWIFPSGRYPCSHWDTVGFFSKVRTYRTQSWWSEIENNRGVSSLDPLSSLESVSLLSRNSSVLWITSTWLIFSICEMLKPELRSWSSPDVEFLLFSSSVAIINLSGYRIAQHSSPE